MTRIQLADLLLRTGLITQDRVQAALSDLRQAPVPGRFTAALVDGGYIDDTTLTRVLSRELSIPWVSLDMPEAPQAVLSLVPRDTAERYSLVPVYIRREQSGPPTLFVAMDDPTWEEALYTVSVMASMPVRPLIAPRSQVRSAFQRWYAPRSDDSRPTCPSIPIADNDDEELIHVEYASELPLRASNA